MSSPKYYHDELNYLKEAGSEFAEYHPNLTHFLGERSSDPDVERLLEGFAFLTGRIREKIDDELPELTNSMMSLMWRGTACPREPWKRCSLPIRMWPSVL